MPTLLLLNGFRFFFYSNENNESIHTHVTKGGAVGKIWLEPSIRIAYFYGFNKGEEKLILEIVENNLNTFKTQWYEFFNK